MTDELLRVLREADRRAYLATLIAPVPKRGALVALWSYANQLATIPLSVSEPAAGEIRLQWWSDVAMGERDEEGRGHPVGAALLDAIELFGLPRAPLAEMAEARSFDLYADPMPDRSAFEAYAGATASVPIQIACRILDPEAANESAEAAGHAGVFATVIDRLATMPRDRASGRVFLPADMLLESWTSPESLLDPAFAANDGSGRMVDAALQYADEHYAQFTAAARNLPASLAAAFAPTQARAVAKDRIVAVGARTFDGVPAAWNAELREQRAIMRAGRLFRHEGAGLLGRFTKLFGR